MLYCLPVSERIKVFFIFNMAKMDSFLFHDFVFFAACRTPEVRATAVYKNRMYAREGVAAVPPKVSSLHKTKVRFEKEG